MDINSVAKKIRQAVMESAEDQGRCFNASLLDEVIAKELRLHMPSPPPAPSNYPWSVVPLVATTEDLQWSTAEMEAISKRGTSPVHFKMITRRRPKDDEWR